MPALNTTPYLIFIQTQNTTRTRLLLGLCSTYAHARRAAGTRRRRSRCLHHHNRVRNEFGHTLPASADVRPVRLGTDVGPLRATCATGAVDLQHPNNFPLPLPTFPKVECRRWGCGFSSKFAKFAKDVTRRVEMYQSRVRSLAERPTPGIPHGLHSVREIAWSPPALSQRASIVSSAGGTEVGCRPARTPG